MDGTISLVGAHLQLLLHTASQHRSHFHLQSIPALCTVVLFRLLAYLTAIATPCSTLYPVPAFALQTTSLVSSPSVQLPI